MTNGTESEELRPDVGWRLDVVSWTVLILMTVLIFYQVMIPPIVGYADNGDFTRVITPLGLTHNTDPEAWEYWYFVDPTYEWVEPGEVELYSSELLLAGLAVVLEKVFANDEIFDIRVIGAVHAVLYLAGMYLILAALQTFERRVRWLAAVCLLLAAADAPYVIFFNSFYAESASIVFFAISLGLLLRSARARYNSTWRTVLLYACVLLFAASKVQNYWLALPLLAAPHLLHVKAPRPRLRRLKVVLTVVSLGVVAGLYLQIPSYYREPVKWDTLFNSILVASPDPEADLAEFGLEPELVEHMGKNAWHQGVPLFETTARYELKDIGLFYLRHPDRFFDISLACAEKCFLWRESRLANRTEVSGHPASAQAPSVTGWSTFQRQLFPASLWFLLGVCAVYVGGAGYAWRLTGKDLAARNMIVFFGAMITMTVLAFLTVIVTEGLTDTIKHLFLFQVFFDVCLVVAVCWLAQKIGEQFPAKWWQASAAVGRDSRRQN